MFKVDFTWSLLLQHQSSPDPSLSSVFPAPLSAAVFPLASADTLQQLPLSPSADLPTGPPATPDEPYGT